jgi:nitrate reductase NapE component
MKSLSIKQAFILFICISVLLVPLIAMQFSNEVNWTVFDFIVAGILLVGTGLTCELIMRKSKKRLVKYSLCFLFLVSFVLIWAELAVGVFGSPIAGN